MNTGEREAFDYCADLVRDVDEDRFLAAQYAPRSERLRLYALYALAAEIARVPRVVSEPPLGEIRLQWWREALDEIALGKTPRAHPVVQAVKAGELLSETTRVLFEEAIDSHARLLYGEPFASVEEVAGWLRRADGGFYAVAGAMLSESVPDFERLKDAGAAFELCRRAGDLAPALLVSEISDYASSMLDEARLALANLEDAALPAMLPVALTRAYLKLGRSPSGVFKRWRLFSAMATGKIAG